MTAPAGSKGAHAFQLVLPRFAIGEQKQNQGGLIHQPTLIRLVAAHLFPLGLVYFYAADSEQLN